MRVKDAESLNPAFGTPKILDDAGALGKVPRICSPLDRVSAPGAFRYVCTYSARNGAAVQAAGGRFYLKSYILAADPESALACFTEEAKARGVTEELTTVNTVCRQLPD